jgi:hypothetical protein
MIDVAQCETCGGELAPAGDDWTHTDPGSACTRFGTPVICRRPDCAMPAEVGGLACRDHSRLSAAH